VPLTISMITAEVALGGEVRDQRSCRPDDNPETGKAPLQQGFHLERMMGLEPTTFCMASRRSSQLSYIRVGDQYSPVSSDL
jgi:hypothetical protein